MEKQLMLTLEKGVTYRFQEGVPAEFTQIIVRAEIGYECVIPKKSEAYLYLTTIEIENGKQVEKSRYKVVKAAETEDMIIDDINGYGQLYLLGTIVGVKGTAMMYNSSIRKKSG